MNAGAPVDGAGPDGRTPLMYAAMFDRLEVLEVLLQSGADRDRPDRGGQRPLTLARTMGARRTVERLERSFDA
jgi:ankyrin repeat protein